MIIYLTSKKALDTLQNSDCSTQRRLTDRYDEELSNCTKTRFTSTPAQSLGVFVRCQCVCEAVHDGPGLPGGGAEEKLLVRPEAVGADGSLCRDELLRRSDGEEEGRDGREDESSDPHVKHNVMSQRQNIQGDISHV